MRFWALCGVLLAAASGGRAATPPSERYPYGGRQFNEFVADSYRANRQGHPNEFYQWMDGALVRAAVDSTGPRKWKTRLTAMRGDVLTGTPEDRAAALKNDSTWLWRTIKRQLPNFSLERGFEFPNVVRLKERQCLLQSVLIGSMLQAAGADAGVVMVCRSSSGEVSNNSHVVAMVRLPTGNDLIVDASGDSPGIRHQGFLAAVPSAGGYRYVDAVYDQDSAEITSYRDVGSGKSLPTTAVRFLDVRFILGQFQYYRGEETPGGLFADRKTTVGLTREIGLLKRSMVTCPQNPLPPYMLGRVLIRLGRTSAARAPLRTAYQLYSQAGWLPPGMRELVALAR